MKKTGIRVASKLRYKQRREMVTKKQVTSAKVTSTRKKRREEGLVFDCKSNKCMVTSTSARTKTLN